MQLPEKMCCFLADEGVSLGYTDRPQIDQPGDFRCRVPVGLPYDAEGLQAAHASGMLPGEHRVRFVLKTQGGEAGFHVVHVEVCGPDGVPRECYAANVALAEGRGQHTVPLALNDPHGVWTLTAVDVATGVTGKASWKD